MQNKELITDDNQRDVPYGTQQLAECIEESWRNTHLSSPDTLKQILVTLPEPYKTMGIQAIAEQFVNIIRFHLLQTIATFYQQAVDEGIDTEERDETLKDIEVDVYHLMMLNRQLSVNSLEMLLRLGKITASIQDLSQCDSVEEAQRWIYKLASIYQGRLEQERLAKKRFNMAVQLTEESTMIPARMITDLANPAEVENGIEK
jgi:hypothetical protein